MAQGSFASLRQDTRARAFGWPWIFFLSVVALLAARQLPLGDRLVWPARRWLVEATRFGGGAVAVTDDPRVDGGGTGRGLVRVRTRELLRT